MLRIFLIITGLVLLSIQHFIVPIPEHWQYIGFLFGIILLGIPHGAADMLVAAQNAGSIKNKSFRKEYLLYIYICRIVLFVFLLLLFPFIGFLIFICFAAYHFGETDLYFFKTENLAGKILVVTYGFVILNVILFNNLGDVKSLLQQSGISWGEKFIDSWALKYRLAVLSFSVLFFFVSIFIYFLKNGYKETIPDSFMIQFAILVFILYNLPLLTGFTFYFIIWHSILSLRNIISYLRFNGTTSIATILKQIGIYSMLAFIGIFISGLAGFRFFNIQEMMMWIFAGLAVLTVPHMQVMHTMYVNIRVRKNNIIYNMKSK